MSLRGKVWFASEVSVLPKLIYCLIQILFSVFFDVDAYVKKLYLKFTSKTLRQKLYVITSKTCISLRQKTFYFYVKKLVKIPLRQKAAVCTSKQYFTLMAQHGGTRRGFDLDGSRRLHAGLPVHQELLSAVSTAALHLTRPMSSSDDRPPGDHQADDAR